MNEMVSISLAYHEITVSERRAKLFAEQAERNRNPPKLEVTIGQKAHVRMRALS